jgi:GNAT superfamily N-acetyltransferase
MAYYHGGSIEGRGSKFLDAITQPHPYDYEDHHSTTPVKSKDGDQLYHHVFTHKNDVRHVLSEHKDPSKPGVAAGLAVHHEGVTVNTAEGKKTVDSGGVVEGIKVHDEKHRGKGYGSQLFHNMIHHHGTIIGDKQYSGEGEALTNKMANHDAYDHVADTKQSIEDSHDEDKVTRRIFSVKDKKAVGKIPKKHLG